MERVTLTLKSVRTLPAPATGRTYYGDTKTKRLAVCVTSAGSRTFYRVGRVNGKPERIRLGTIDDLSVEQARKACDEITGKAAAGNDPVAERRGRTRPMAELWEWYLAHHSQARKRTWKKDESRWRRELAGWANRPIVSITIEDVQRRVSEVGAARGPFAGNKVRELLRHLFAVAISIGWAKANPVIGVKRFKVQPRERFLQPGEVERFFHWLDKSSSEPFRDLVRLCIFTGARRGNVAAMRWDHVDLESALWSMPGAATKTNEPIVVVLAPPAVDVLRRRLAAAAPDARFVFPSKAASGFYSWPRESWDTLLVRAGFAKSKPVTRTVYGKPRQKREVYDRQLRLHDLRRTLGSWQASNMVPLNIIGKSLGHRSLASTQIYARLQLAPVRQAVEQAAADIVAAAAKKTPGDAEKKPKPL